MTAGRRHLHAVPDAPFAGHPAALVSDEVRALRLVRDASAQLVEATDRLRSSPQEAQADVFAAWERLVAALHVARLEDAHR